MKSIKGMGVEVILLKSDQKVKYLILDLFKGCCERNEGFCFFG